MENNETLPTPVPAKKGKAHGKANVAKKQSDLVEQASVANVTWKNNPDYKLTYITQPEFENHITILRASIVDKSTGKGDLKGYTHQLKTHDIQIDNDVITMKAYLKGKYKSDAKARPYYLKFGIDFSRGFYGVSRDRSERIKALNLIIAALVSEGFSNYELGLAYWTATRDKYVELFNLTNKLAGDISMDVSDTKQTILIVTDTLNSIIHLAKANNPRTYPAVLRSLGFQKEKF